MEEETRWDSVAEKVGEQGTSEAEPREAAEGHTLPQTQEKGQLSAAALEEGLPPDAGTSSQIVSVLHCGVCEICAF